MKNKRILITGGHLTPALSVIDVLKIHTDLDIVFVGRRVSLEKEQSVSEEERLILKRNIPFYPIDAGRLTRSVDPGTVRSLFRIPKGFIQAFHLIRILRPDVILSFGGYVGLPIAVFGVLFHIPVVVHEQSVVPGLSNRLIGWIANKIFLTYQKTKKYFPDRSEVIGLPVRNGIFTPPNHPSFTVPRGKPIIYIAGGSTGSVSINTIIKEVLPELLQSYTVIHQTGRVSQTDMETLKSSLPSHHKEHYIPLPYVEEPDLAWIYAHAHLYIGRSGANTVMELMLTGMPAIYIPLPWASHQEQMENAQISTSYGQSDILPQEELSSQTLLTRISHMIRTTRVRSMHPDITASKDAAQHIAAYLNKIVS